MLLYYFKQFFNLKRNYKLKIDHKNVYFQKPGRNFENLEKILKKQVANLIEKINKI